VDVIDLRCEHRVNPLGLDVLHPSLSWALHSDRRAQKQLAYQVLVHADGALLWDSGRVESDRTTHVPYAGQPLTSHLDCRWQVRAWDQDGTATEWSAEARWSMGLLHPADWQADWIGSPDPRPPVKARPEPFLPPCPYFRRAFTVTQPVKRAVLHATAFGLYEARLNGHKVSSDYFTPGWTDYGKRLYYNTYDVTALLRQGANALGAILAEGWYCGHVGLLLTRVAGMPTGRDRYGDHPFLRLQLRLEHADGSVQTIGTDDSWRVTDGPHREADILMGETYDARRELPGWDLPGYDDSAWQKPVVRRGLKPRTLLQAYPGVTVQQTQTLTPVGRTEPRPGVFVFDMGQNFAGRVRLAVEGPAGTRVVLRFAEMLHANGTLMTENLQQARATDTYILKGAGREVWEPHFTYHGFRHVEVTGYPGTPPLDAVSGVVLHSAMPTAGAFECSQPLVNQLYRNITWTQRANFFDIPTDCPQRDERLGWTGDAALYVRSAAYNADVAAFFTKWLVDLADSQRRNGAFPNYAPMLYQWRGDNANSPAWGDAGIVCPYTLYRTCADTRLIEQHWEAMTRFMDYQLSVSEGFIGPDRGFGDWLAVGETTRKDLVATACWARNARLMAEMAEALGREGEARSYRDLFATIKEMFGRVFVYGDARLRGNTQTSYALAINLGLLPDEMLPAAGRNLVERIEAKGGHLSAGFVGLEHLLPALTRTGHLEVAYRLLTDTSYPSWGYSIRNGATTIWERWDSWTEEKGFKNSRMNSFCHYAPGSVCAWLFDTVAGIDTEGPGFNKIVIRPRPGGGLTWVKASYHGQHGPIRVHWEVLPEAFRLNVEIPTNTTAAVHIAAAEEDVREGGRPARAAEGVRYQGRADGCAVYQVGSGTYAFEARSPYPC
jgi:alpha-L-rhamnosidase